MEDARWRQEIRRGILSVWAGPQPDEARANSMSTIWPTPHSTANKGARHVGPVLTCASPEKGAEKWLSQTTEQNRSHALKETTQLWAKLHY